MPASEAFFKAYVICALWSSTDNVDDSGGAPLDDNYGPEDVAPESIAAMRSDCDNFADAQSSDLAASGLGESQQGHDFWLTRNGHGAGFWDRGIGEVGDRLTDAAHAYGSCDLYVGDDGRIYAS